MFNVRRLTIRAARPLNAKRIPRAEHGGAPGEVKHLSTRRKRKQTFASLNYDIVSGASDIPQVAASEKGTAQTFVSH